MISISSEVKTAAILSFAFVFCSCSVRDGVVANHSFLSGSDRKQKQKVVVLQKKLEIAERSLAKNQAEVEDLRSLLYDAQLDSIESRVAMLERKWQIDPVALSQALYQETARLFLEERETLHQILQANVSVHRAQSLIDRILQLITQINDCAIRAP